MTMPSPCFPSIRMPLYEQKTARWQNGVNGKLTVGFSLWWHVRLAFLDTCNLARLAHTLMVRRCCLTRDMHPDLRSRNHSLALGSLHKAIKPSCWLARRSQRETVEGCYYWKIPQALRAYQRRSTKLSLPAGDKRQRRICQAVLTDSWLQEPHRACFDFFPRAFHQLHLQPSLLWCRNALQLFRGGLEHGQAQAPAQICEAKLNTTPYIKLLRALGLGLSVGD